MHQKSGNTTWFTGADQISVMNNKDYCDWILISKWETNLSTCSDYKYAWSSEIILVLIAQWIGKNKSNNKMPNVTQTHLSIQPYTKEHQFRREWMLYALPSIQLSSILSMWQVSHNAGRSSILSNRRKSWRSGSIHAINNSEGMNW